MLTGDDSHVATRRGFAGKQLIEAGESVPAGIPVGSWMKAKAKPEAAPKPKKAK